MVVVAPVDGPVEPALQVAEDLAAEGAAVTVLVADDRDAVEYRGPVAVRRMKVRAARAAARPTRARRAAGAALSRLPRGWRYVLPHVEEHEAVAGGHLDQAVAVAVVGVGTDTAVAAARAVGRAQLRHRTVRWVHVDVAGRGPAERIAPEAARALRRTYLRHADVVVPAGGDVGAAVRVAVGTAWPVDATSRPRPVVVEAEPRTAPPVDRPAELPLRVGFGPANMAGQAWEWAKALERARPDVSTHVLMVDRGSVLRFRADEVVPASVFSRDATWQVGMREQILTTWTHAVFESGRPLTGTLNGPDLLGDLAMMAEHGLGAAMVLHGSEVRDPRAHVEREPWSPFTDPRDPWVVSVQAAVDHLAPLLARFPGPCMVSTPDLLLDLPGAVWLPVVVDTELWRPGPPVLEREVPVVLHAPSREATKGSHHVDRVLAPLARAGRIEYRRLQGVGPEEMPAAVAAADVVIDQFSIGTYGVLPCEAMAAGRLVVSHVSDQVREHVLTTTGLELPVVQATPDTLPEVLDRLVADRDTAREVADAGPGFVRAVHSGETSAAVLVRTLQLSGGSPTDR